MDVVTVSKKDYSLGRLVENLSTKIWTERFQDPGQCEFHTEAIGYGRSILPEGAFCSIRNSNEVMIIENHTIQKSPQTDVPELVITGRTLDSFLENRQWHAGAYGKQAKMAQHYTVRQAVEIWIWNSIVNDTGNDVINTDASNSTSDVLPNVVVSDSVPAASDGDSQARKVANGDIYTQMRAFLTMGKLGIRIIRPNGTKGKKVSVSGSGDFSTDHVDPFNKLRFDIYQGRDLTGRVNFTEDDLLDAQYLFNIAAFKTGAFVDGDVRSHYVTDPDALPGPNTGWNKRDGYVDGGSMDDPKYPSGATDAEKATILENHKDDFEDSLKDQGLKQLRKDWKKIAIIGNTSISPFTPHKYGHNYRLGDRVSVRGKYGIHQNMWVTEFIRSEDEVNGEVGYPTLSATPS